MKYAWIENDRIRDVAWTDPEKIYHPDIAKFYDTQVPDDAVNGDGWINGQLVKPAPQPVSTVRPVLPRVWSDVDFRDAMSLSEKVKWDNNSAPEIVTVKAELPKDQAGAQELVDFLVSSNVISQETAQKIMG